MDSNCETLPANISIDIKVDSTAEGNRVVLELEEPGVEPKKESELETKMESNEPKKVGLKERLEFNQFIRTSDESNKIRPRGSCKIILARRPTMIKLLEPDNKIFKDLDDVEPWDETLLPPLPEDCTPGIIASIKKGMLLGKLYNVSKKTLKVIYPRLSIIKNGRLVKGKGWIEKRCFRCPLCPADFPFRGKYCERHYNHIEQYHTSSLVTCIKCHHVLTCYESVKKHKAKEHKNCQ